MGKQSIELVFFDGCPNVGLGRDVTGETPGAAAMACRADGVPSAALILEKLR